MRGGRPSKGERHLFQSRVPLDVRDFVFAEATRLGVTYSDYIARLLVEHAGTEPPPYLQGFTVRQPREETE